MVLENNLKDMYLELQHGINPCLGGIWSWSNYNENEDKKLSWS